MTAAVERVDLSRDEARSLTDEVRGDAERLWRKLVELYDGHAHEALGYGSWGAYFQAEFGQSRRQAYLLLDAGRVMRELNGAVQNSALPTNVDQAYALAPLKNDPEALKEAWSEAVEMHEKPTAADVREVVQQKVGPMSRKAEMNANAASRRVYSGLSSIDGYARALVQLDADRILSVATTDDIAAWDGLARDAISRLRQLRRALKETQ